MKVIKGYKTELAPTNKQRTLLLQHAGIARFAYNWGLNRVKEGISKPNAMQLHKDWNQWKKQNIPWWSLSSKCTPQEALRNLERAFKTFFDKCKKKKQGKFKGKVGFPKFKSNHNGVGSFRLTGTIKVFEKAVQLPVLGKLKLKERGYIPTADIKILAATVSERAGRWFVSIQCEQEVPEPIVKPTAVVGIDLGIKTLAVCSDGKTYENPKVLRNNLKQLKHLQRHLSRKVKGSKNRKLVAQKVAKLHLRIANIRKDTIHKMTTDLTKTKSLCVIEDLNVAGMMKNHCLAQAIADLGLGEWRRQMEYKGKLYGCGILVADRYYPSSKTCSACGCIKEDLTLADREWTCADCGTHHDRDRNASTNLENYGKIVAVSSTETLNSPMDGQALATT